MITINFEANARTHIRMFVELINMVISNLASQERNVHFVISFFKQIYRLSIVFGRKIHINHFTLIYAIHLDGYNKFSKLCTQMQSAIYVMCVGEESHN